MAEEVIIGFMKECPCSETETLGTRVIKLVKESKFKILKYKREPDGERYLRIRDGFYDEDFDEEKCAQVMNDIDIGFFRSLKFSDLV